MLRGHRLPPRPAAASQPALAQSRPENGMTGRAGLAKLLCPCVTVQTTARHQLLPRDRYRDRCGHTASRSTALHGPACTVPRGLSSRPALARATPHLPATTAPAITVPASKEEISHVLGHPTGQQGTIRRVGADRRAR